MNECEKTALENKYLRVSAKVLSILDETGELEAVSDIIREDLELQSIYTGIHRQDTETLKIAGYSINSDFPSNTKDLIIRFVSGLVLDLKIFKGLKALLTNIDSPEIIHFPDLLRLLKTDNNQKSIEKIIDVKRGETCLIPLKNPQKELGGFLLAVKKEGEIFAEDEINLFMDIIHSISMAIKNRNLIYIDEFTKLGNVKEFKRVITKKIAQRDEFFIFLICITDLEKIISSKGEEVGKYCIRYMAEILRQELEGFKKAAPFRNSTTKFLCYIRFINKEDAGKFAEKILSLVASPIKMGGHIINLSLHLGICHSKDIRDVEDILQNCKRALEKSRESGKTEKTRYRFYDEALMNEVEKDNRIESALKSAINEPAKSLFVYYQPKINTSGTLVGYEALCRWMDPVENKIVSMGEYMEKISKLGLSDILFRFVFDTVCRDAPELEKEVSINMEPEQFGDIEIIKDIKDILAKYDNKNLVNQLKLEILETDMIDYDNYYILKGIRDLGIKISMDDFGTGYSNLKRVLTLIKKQLVDEIKIDKGLIDDIHNDTRFFTTITNIGYKFQINIVVEGIEDEEQFRIIKRNFPPAILQGFLFSQAKPLKEIRNIDENIYKEIFDRIIPG